MKTYESIIDPNAVDAYLAGVDFRTMTDWEADRFLMELGLPLPDRQNLMVMASAVDPVLRWKAVQDRFLPLDSLRMLAHDESNEIRSYVASHQNTPSSVLTELAMDGDELVRASVAGNKHTSPRVLASLAQDPSAGVRIALMDNSEVDASILDAMVRDRDPMVRMTVASKSNTPSLLRNLVFDADRVVIACLAANPSAPVDVLRSVFESFVSSEEDCVPWVMVNLAVHESTDAYILQAIAEHRVIEAREVAVSRLGGNFIRQNELQ